MREKKTQIVKVYGTNWLCRNLVEWAGTEMFLLWKIVAKMNIIVTKNMQTSYLFVEQVYQLKVFRNLNLLNYYVCSEILNI